MRVGSFEKEVASGFRRGLRRACSRLKSRQVCPVPLVELSRASTRMMKPVVQPTSADIDRDLNNWLDVLLGGETSLFDGVTEPFTYDPVATFLFCNETLPHPSD